MITVPEAARRLRKNPETIRRWIRAGKLPSQKIGTQHLIEEEDLDDYTGDEPKMLPAPERNITFWGAPMPDVAAWVRESRRGH